MSSAHGTKLLQKVLALCQRRGFIFHRDKEATAAFDYGPLGAELKRNLINEWWHEVVTSTGNVHAVDSSILIPSSEDGSNDPQYSGDSLGDGHSGIPRGYSLRSHLRQGGLLYLLQCAKCLGLKPPFGIAEVGKVFRHESALEYCLFRMKEFEQFHLQFFCSPSEHRQRYSHWQKKRLTWWKKFAKGPEKFLLTESLQGDIPELAGQHSNIKFEFPWGLHDIESVTNRKDSDLRTLTENSSPYKIVKSNGEKVLPFVISTTAGADRGMLALLCDAYTEIKRPYGPEKELRPSVVLKLHTCLAPYKVAVLPSDPTNHKLCVYCRMLADELMTAGVRTLYKDVGSFTYRLIEQDEMGTPYRVVADENTLETGTVGLQVRDTAIKEEMNGQDVLPSIQRMLLGARLN